MDALAPATVRNTGKLRQPIKVRRLRADILIGAHQWAVDVQMMCLCDTRTRRPSMYSELSEIELVEDAFSISILASVGIALFFVISA